MKSDALRRLVSWLLLLVLGLGVSAWAQEPRTEIVWDLAIEGNQALGTSLIKDSIITKESSWVPLVGPTYEFDPIAFEADQRRIERLYKRYGYHRAVVKRTEIKPCSKENRICIRIFVEEGEPSLVRNIRVRINRSNPPVGDEDVLGIFGLTAGEIFNHDRYVEAKQAVVRYLRERSYPFAKVEGSALYDAEANRFDIDLTVSPGNAARFGFVIFEGLKEVLSEDVQARIPIRTGEWFDPALYEQSESLLARLDVFRTISPELKSREPRPGEPDAPSVVDVIFHVRETNFKTLRFGGGLRVENSRQEVRGRAEWVNRNFYHHLRRFSIRAEPAYAVLPSITRPNQSGPLGTVEIAQRYPAFLSPFQDLDTAIGFDGDLEQGYSWYGPRAGASIERQLSREVSGSMGYAFRYLTFYNVDLTFSSASRLVPPELLFSKNYRLGFLNQRIVWDRRDEVLEPNRGILAQFSFAESAPPLGSAFTYLRAQPELRWYIPMTRRATLAVRGLYGQIFPISGRATPITERFYGGGANSHRAFSYHRLAPQVTTADGRPVPVGGNVEMLLSAEQRVRLFRISDSWVIGALFLDAGDVVEDPQDFDYRVLHYGAGTGFRYESPVGVIRGDVGFRLNRLSDRTDGRPNPDPGSRFAVHISLGEAF